VWALTAWLHCGATSINPTLRLFRRSLRIQALQTHGRIAPFEALLRNKWAAQWRQRHIMLPGSREPSQSGG